MRAWLTILSDEDEEDETAALMRELEKIKKERAAAKAKEEAERAAEEEEQREIDVARGNPLLNAKDFTMKRRWDDDVVFKNQARGTEDRNKKKEFINDMLRSDFHKKFMVRLQFPLFPTRLTQPPVQIRTMRSSRFSHIFSTFNSPSLLAFLYLGAPGLDSFTRSLCIAWDTPDLGGNEGASDRTESRGTLIVISISSNNCHSRMSALSIASAHRC